MKRDRGTGVRGLLQGLHWGQPQGLQRKALSNPRLSHQTPSAQICSSPGRSQAGQEPGWAQHSCRAWLLQPKLHVPGAWRALLSPLQNEGATVYLHKLPRFQVAL